MAKKEEKLESCSCGCEHGGGRVFGVSVSALGAIFSIITCLVAFGALIVAQKSYEASQASYEVSKASYDFNVLSAGGIDNFNRMSKVYESDAYVKYASDNAAQAESYFGLGTDETTIAEGDEDVDVDTTESKYIAGGDEIKALVESLLASNPARGNTNGRFTIIEYTELLCPYCQRHSQQGTINAVIEQFPGEVNSISKSFIIHGEEALKLSSAMECVAELNPSTYHEVFEKAFEAYPVDMDTLISIATGLGTDESALKACVDEGRYTQAVEDGMNQASSIFGVNGTPGNVIIDRENGNYIVVSGAYPVEEFVNAINELKNA